MQVAAALHQIWLCLFYGLQKQLQRPVVLAVLQLCFHGESRISLATVAFAYLSSPSLLFKNAPCPEFLVSSPFPCLKGGCKRSLPRACRTQARQGLKEHPR